MSQPNNKPKTQVKFKITTNLTAVSFIAKKTDKVLTKKHKSHNYNKISKWDRMFPDIKVVDPNYIFPVQENSIQQLLNSCHRDVKEFINQNEIAMVNAGSDGVVITTKNRFRVNISTLGTHKRKIIITDSKRNIMLKTECYSVVEVIRN